MTAALEVVGITHDFRVEGRALRAIDGVDLAVADGEALGIVGESGCGKTTLGRALVMLQRPTGGAVAFAGVELTPLRGRALRLVQMTVGGAWPFGSMRAKA